MDAPARFLIKKLSEAVANHLFAILIALAGILFMNIVRVVAGKLFGIVIPAVGCLFMRMVKVVAGQLSAKLLSAKNQISLVLHLEDKIESLRKQLADLKTVILRAEVKPKTEEMHVGFKNFVKEAEGRLRRNEVANRPPTVFKTLLKVCGYLPSSLGLGLLVFYVRIAVKIKGLFGELEKLKSDLDRCQLVAGAMECLDVVSEYTDEVVELPKRLFCFVGRKKEKEQLMKELLSEPLSKPSVVLVTGLGGIGKDHSCSVHLPSAQSCEVLCNNP